MSAKPIIERIVCLIIIWACLYGLHPASADEQTMSESQVWFAPNLGSTDMLKLFTHPSEWASVRADIDVFKFYTGHVASGDQSCKGTVRCGSNYLKNFVKVDAFAKLKKWGVDIAIESLYPFPNRSQSNIPQCATGEWAVDYATKISTELIRYVHSNGGTVRYLAMDEPVRKWYPHFFGEERKKRPCLYDSLSKLADDVAAYIQQVNTTYPSVGIGQIELYPEVSVSQLQEWVSELEKRGISLPFLHLDVHQATIDAYRKFGVPIDVKGDLQTLKSYLDARNIAFGIIFTDTHWQKYRSDQYTDKMYFENTTEWIRFVKKAIDKPDHSIFQSWVISYTQKNYEKITKKEFLIEFEKRSQRVPINLPENDPTVYSHTRLIREGLSVLRGEEMRVDFNFGHLRILDISVEY